MLRSDNQLYLHPIIRILMTLVHWYYHSSTLTFHLSNSLIITCSDTTWYCNNSLWPIDVMWWQRPWFTSSGNSLLPDSTQPLPESKPCKVLPEPKLTFCQLHPTEEPSVKFESTHKYFLSRRCIWKCGLQNGSHVVNVLTPANVKARLDTKGWF